MLGCLLDSVRNTFSPPALKFVAVFSVAFSLFSGAGFPSLPLPLAPPFPPASPAVYFLSFVAGVAALLGIDADVSLPHLGVGGMKTMIADAVANVADSFRLAHVSGFLELCLILLLPVPSPPAPLAFRPTSPLSPIATLPSLAFLPLSLPLLPPAASVRHQGLHSVQQTRGQGKGHDVYVVVV